MHTVLNFVSLLDNIMVGRIGTEQMSGVAIANQLFMVFNITIFGGVSGASIFGAQYISISPRIQKSSVATAVNAKLRISLNRKVLRTPSLSPSP